LISSFFPFVFHASVKGKADEKVDEMFPPRRAMKNMWLPVDNSMTEKRFKGGKTIFFFSI